MTISVFTPIHQQDNETVLRAYRSLCAQTVKPTEWVLLMNGKAEFWRPAGLDDAPFLVKIFSYGESGSIGTLKAVACANCSGDILVELDYDDELTPTAIEDIASVFMHQPQVKFVYSNSIEILPDGTNNLYGPKYGWRHREVEWDENIFGKCNVAFPEQAHYMRRIEWAPNHVRAFREDAYREIGGYDVSLAVGDDHDLVCRFYRAFGERGFYHIDECLYIYHIHPGNTSNGRNRNAEIQAQVDINYCRHAEEMYMRWAADRRLDCLDLGGRIGKPEGYLSVDLLDADIIQDLNAHRWDIEDDSIGVIRAYHVLEHLDDPINFFNECYRILAPGGFLLIEVPSVNGPGAFGDPTHKRFFNTLTFEYFTNQQYARFIQPQYSGRFQKARVQEYVWPNGIPVISAQLIALKGWYESRWCGLKEM